MLEKLERLYASRAAITARVVREKRKNFTASEDAAFRDFTEQIKTHKAEMARAGYGDEEVRRVKRATTDADWATRAATKMQKMGGETRGVVSGSIDIPTLVETEVTPKARPDRLLDLLVNRQIVLPGNGFEYYRQSVRTNNAAPVADAATKPTSTFTVTPVSDTVRVIAHLSEPIPLRLLDDHEELRNFLESEMAEGVLDALEYQLISGPGTGVTFTGVLNAAGITPVPYDTSITKTLRSALTATQVAGERPTAWVLSPADAATLDLTLETSGNGFLLDGYQTGTAGSGNVFGNALPRVVSPSVPTGVALLADWTKLRLYVREDVRIDVDTSGTALFDANLAKMRAEGRFGMGLLRPSSFYVVDLTP